MAAWGYEFYLPVLKYFWKYFSTASLTRERYFQHSKIKFYPYAVM